MTVTFEMLRDYRNGRRGIEVGLGELEVQKGVNTDWQVGLKTNHFTYNRAWGWGSRRKVVGYVPENLTFICLAFSPDSLK